jgi:hypothetical protein
MTPAIQVGAILVKEWPMQEVLAIESDAFTGNWSLIKLLDSSGLDARSVPWGGVSSSWPPKQRRCSSERLEL